MGLAAQGACFTVIAVLALALAAGAGGEATDPQGAFRALDRHAWARALLVFLAFGFAAYALWRLAQALLDRGGHGTDPGGLGRRAIQFVQGVIGIALAASAVRVLAGSGGHGGRTSEATAGVLGWPGGTVLVAAVGAGFVVVGLVNVYWGLSGRFRESLRLDQLSAQRERVLSLLGKIGFVALAVVLVIVGWFLLKAAVDFSSSQAVSLGGALAKLANATYGKWLLGITASGLLAFGLFELAQARYHRV